MVYVTPYEFNDLFRTTSAFKHYDKKDISGILFVDFIQGFPLRIRDTPPFALNIFGKRELPGRVERDHLIIDGLFEN